MTTVREPLPRSAWTRLAACTAAAALLQLDGTVITVALPSVARRPARFQRIDRDAAERLFRRLRDRAVPRWPLVDRFGARRVALLGLAVFAVGAALGAVVSSLGFLIATRVLQGAGAGLVSPAALAGAVSGFPPERRGSRSGSGARQRGCRQSLGPLLGGLLTVAFGWRAAWWALVPLALASASGGRSISAADRLRAAGKRPSAGAQSDRVLPRRGDRGAYVRGDDRHLLPGRAIPATGDRLLRARRPSAVLVVVALLVGAAAPLAGRLADRNGERLPAVIGFFAAGAGLTILAIPGVSLHGIGTGLALIPVGLGLGMLFVPTSRAALNATPAAAHGRTSSLLSAARLVGAASAPGWRARLCRAGRAGRMQRRCTWPWGSPPPHAC